jgi:hypothetical protein
MGPLTLTSTFNITFCHNPLSSLCRGNHGHGTYSLLLAQRRVQEYVYISICCSEYPEAPNSVRVQARVDKAVNKTGRYSRQQSCRRKPNGGLSNVVGRQRCITQCLDSVGMCRKRCPDTAYRAQAASQRHRNALILHWSKQRALHVTCATEKNQKTC